MNFSNVEGQFNEELQNSLPGQERAFRASGLSLVLHPRNPHVPTVHANFRIILRGSLQSPEKLWFGGGADLTPSILYEEDARHFHELWQELCDRHSVANYAQFKKQCDEYFWLTHRREARGVGGIFFDYLQGDLEAALRFVLDGASCFLASYVPIVERRSAIASTPAQRTFQLWRRGRYAEFNLLHDRGTQFGLRTGGRIESILMSMPPLAAWQYDRKANSAEEQRLLNVLRFPRDWLESTSADSAPAD